MTDTSPKPFVFVLMPFDDSFSDVYELGIKPACIDAGAYAERVDEQIFSESILQRIYNQIAKADVVISDMTSRNPNVFYETGYAHALGKNVILLTHNSDDIPFDLKHYPHIVYGGSIRDLKPELSKRVRWAIANPTENDSPLSPLLEFFHEGKPLVGSPSIDVQSNQGHLWLIRLKLDIHNPSENRVEPQDFRVAFVTSNRIPRSQSQHDEPLTSIKLPKGGYIHLPDEAYSLLPGGWESIHIELKADDELSCGDTENIILRVFTYSGTIDIPFSIKVT